MAPGKANVDKSTTIRAASKSKQRAQPSNRGAASPFGSSAGGSLADSLSSLFSPQPHGKDAALASLLASTSKPPTASGPKSGLSAFGSFPTGQSSASSKPPSAAPSQLLDQKSKSKQSEPKVKESASSAKQPKESSKDAQPRPGADQLPSKPIASTQASTSKPASSSVISSPKPTIAQVPAGRRPVFRPVLASSTAVTWPEMPVAGSKTVLHTLLETLASPEVKQAVLKDLGRKSSARSLQPKRQLQVTSSAPSVSAAPQVLAGINSITRALEAEIHTELSSLQASAADGAKQKVKSAALVPQIEIVFVCRHDAASSTLVAHLPMLVAARNAVSASLTADDSVKTRGTLLFALPSASEALLARALGLRRASVVALTSAFSATHLRRLLDAVQRETGSVCRLRAAWLETALRAAKGSERGPLALPQLPPTVKLLRTTQPLDLNASKAANKSRRKERSARWKKRKMQLQQSIRSLRAELKHAAKAKRQAKRASQLSTDSPMQIDA
ncbi:ribonucleases p mrp protein subunit pop3 kda subunit [Moesziomyces antarcticus]|uniref:Ribonucleases p mrp protein subunit pop3 kDa subunit n=2 Tax=Pseudozyma antarctica TaxID=84753 RepID=A0A081CGI8_PSEA2|nr:ribonucleases p mrp protein subunit pop3 kda subunit [Moesziomyces antarcticus]GAK65784.1 ribonucleases p mrp protein subunit pop3 kda subunit [Moesziomyces antarcticus]SPO45413.1 uncharacterized protein PSANT_03099 [Moesziomyces antarcticus]